MLVAAADADARAGGALGDALGGALVDVRAAASSRVVVLPATDDDAGATTAAAVQAALATEDAWSLVMLVAWGGGTASVAAPDSPPPHAAAQARALSALLALSREAQRAPTRVGGRIALVTRDAWRGASEGNGAVATAAATDSDDDWLHGVAVGAALWGFGESARHELAPRGVSLVTADVDAPLAHAADGAANVRPRVRSPVQLYTKQTSIERRSNAAQDNDPILRTYRFCVGRARALTAPSWFPLALQLAGFAAGILLTRRSISKR